MSMNFGSFRHNFEGFVEKFTYPMCIYKGRTTTIQGAHVSLIETLFTSLYFIVKSVKKEIQSSNDYVDTTRC